MKTNLMQIEMEVPEWPRFNQKISTITFSKEPFYKTHFTVNIETKINGKAITSEYSSTKSLEYTIEKAKYWLKEKRKDLKKIENELL